MSLRDQAATPELSLADMAILEALREDRDSDGDGVSPMELSSRAGPHWKGAVRHLRKCRFVIGTTSEGWYQMGHDEPAWTGAPDDRGLLPPVHAGDTAEVAQSVGETRAINGEPLVIFDGVGFDSAGGGPYTYSDGCPNCHADQGWAIDYGQADTPCSRACTLQLEYAAQLGSS